MDLQKAFKTRDFLDAIAESVRNVIYDSFPGMSPQEKEEVEQEVKFKIWRAAARGKNIRRLRSYLWKTIYTTALDIIKKRMKYVPLEDLRQEEEIAISRHMSAFSPENRMTVEESAGLVRASIRGLKARRRAVVELHFLGKHLSDIAARLGLSENQARHLLYRGLQDLAVLVRKRLHCPSLSDARIQGDFSREGSE